MGALAKLFGRDEAPPVPDIGLDTAFDLLRNERRRRVLRIVADHPDEGIKLTEVAEILAGAEATRKDATAADLKKQVYVALYQSHVPKLEEHGLVTRDSDVSNPSSGALFPTAQTAVALDAIDDMTEHFDGGAR